MLGQSKYRLFKGEEACSKNQIKRGSNLGSSVNIPVELSISMSLCALNIRISLYLRRHQPLCLTDLDVKVLFPREMKLVVKTEAVFVFVAVNLIIAAIVNPCVHFRNM